jgi:peptidoglycan-associated lipoprotein
MNVTNKIHNAACVTLVATMVAAAACGGKKPRVAEPVQPPPADTAAAAPAPAPPTPVVEPRVATPAPVREESVASASLDDLNRNTPLRPVFFDLDSAELNAQSQAILNQDAAVMKQNPTWSVTVEGHCDERGSAEYNLALGERRAVAARTYLVSLGIPAERLRTVSYGKEFPFEPGHDESAWSKNRRAHFVITSK